MIRRLLDAACPDAAVRGMGHVGWRTLWPVSEVSASGGFCAPVAMRYDVSEDLTWPGHKPWPSIYDLFPRLMVERGGITFS